MRPTPRSSRPRLLRRREKKVAGESLVDAVIEEAAAVIAVEIAVAEAGAQAAIVEIAAEAVAVVEVTAAVAVAGGIVGVASGAVASAGPRTGRDRRWAPAQARSKAK